MKVVYKNCELFAVDTPAINTVDIVAYRPFKPELEECNEILTKVKEVLKPK